MADPARFNLLGLRYRQVGPVVRAEWGPVSFRRVGPIAILRAFSIEVRFLGRRLSLHRAA